MWDLTGDLDAWRGVANRARTLLAAPDPWSAAGLGREESTGLAVRAFRLSYESLWQDTAANDRDTAAMREDLEPAGVGLAQRGLIIGALTCPSPRIDAKMPTPEDRLWVARTIVTGDRDRFRQLFSTYAGILELAPEASNAEMQRLGRGLAALGRGDDPKVVVNQLGMRCVLTPYLLLRKREHPTGPMEV